MHRAVATVCLIWTIACAYPSAASAAECVEDRADLRGTWGQAAFSVEIADTPGERATGLMNRDSMATTHGMLFVYPAAQFVSFWMKNTLIPLDLLFLTSDGQVARIHENAVPHDLTSIPGGENIQFVLEINGGMVARLGITEGSELRHPALDQSVSLWSCDAIE